jgi:hypothetical protein
MAAHPIDAYLHALREGRALGVAETSFYGPLAALLNAAGATLKPRVRCIIHPKSVAYWRNVPQRVWEYTIGGYQVIKKWLSYRERDLLGRALLPEEAREVTAIARRIAALLLLAPQLDANYRAVAAATHPWKA